MKHFASSFLAFAAGSATLMVGAIDARQFITQSVLDGSFVEKVERVHPYVGIDGTVYVREAQDKNRKANRNALRRHCYLGAPLLGSTASQCGVQEL